MATKRSADGDSGSTNSPAEKKLKTQFEPIKIGPIYSLEELDIKVLQFQNKKLAERIEQRRKAEDDLRKRIEQLEQRQTTDDAVLCIVNRYWNQLDEDVRLLVQRFDADSADETGKDNESTAVTSFLTLLSQWDRQEIEEKLKQRVEFSKRAIGKLIQAYDRVIQRNEKLWAVITEKDDENEKSETSSVDGKSVKKELGDEKKDLASIKTEVKGEVKADLEGDTSKKSLMTTSMDKVNDGAVDAEVKVKKEPGTGSSTPSSQVKTEDKEGKEAGKKPSAEKPRLGISEAVRKEMERIVAENRRIQDLATTVHQKNHEITLKNSELMDKLTASETEAAELKNLVDDLEYELDSAKTRVTKLDCHLSDAMQKLKTFQEGEITVQGGGEGVSKNKFIEIVNELEEQKELATNRLTELEKLQRDHTEALKTIESLKMDLSTLPESVIVETTDYLCLKSQFSVLYNESMQIRTQLEDTRTLLASLKNTHLRQIEQMESDELMCQKKLRTEVIQLEDQLAQVRREYEMLRIEFEQTLAANEQTGPINREMRNLISSLKNHNEQLKGEVARYRRKLRETQLEVNKLHEMNRTAWRKLTTQQTQQQQQQGQQLLKQQPQQLQKQQLQQRPQAAVAKCDLTVPSELKSDQQQLPATPQQPQQQQQQQKGQQQQQQQQSSSESQSQSREKDKEDTPPKQLKPDEAPTPSRKESEERERDAEREKGKTDPEIIRDLKVELKRSLDRERDLKLLLDTYKCLPKESRDKAQLISGEKRARQEIEELRAHIRRLQEAERKDRRKLAEDDALRKIKKCEDVIAELQKNLAAQKQEEEALLNEMEVTGQAFEDMQEQNIRLLQQLREKDDANFKLMSERIKSNQIHKLLREEKDVLAEQVMTLQHQVEAQNVVVRKLEDKEAILQVNLAVVEKELGCRQQASEMFKRKAVESSQSAADLKLHLDKYHSQLKEAQATVTDKTAALQQETFKYKRKQEEIASLRRKLERAKKIEQASSADDVLMEEIREYKEQLTCPSCKVKKKDAVLTKCFHVFCLECLRTRYETRQRKCPKCNATFGANDFHRIYLE